MYYHSSSCKKYRFDVEYLKSPKSLQRGGRQVAITADSVAEEETDSDATSLQAICLLRHRSELLEDVAEVEAELRTRGIPFQPVVTSSSSCD